MKTIEVMSSTPRAIRAIERLDAAARALWERDCGLVPVVDAQDRLVGVVTDRDLCMASYFQGRALNEIPVQAVMARELVTCRADEDVAEVMRRMQDSQVHRLPVVDALGHLVGIVSTNDIVRAAHGRPAAVDPAAVVRTIATIGAPRAADDATPTVERGPVAVDSTPADGASIVASAPSKRAAAAARDAGTKRPARKGSAPMKAASKTTAKKAAKKGAKKAAPGTRTGKAAKKASSRSATNKAPRGSS